MDATWKVSGLQQLGERMRALKTDVAEKLAFKATGAAAQVVKKAAIQNVVTSPSVDTGKLRDSIVAKKITQTDLTAEHIVTVRTREAPHAIFLEYGTVKMPAEPYIRPALSEHKGEAVDAMRDVLANGIAKAGG